MYQDKLFQCKQTAERQQRPSKARMSVWVFFLNCHSSVQNLTLTFHLQLTRGGESSLGVGLTPSHPAAESSGHTEDCKENIFHWPFGWPWLSALCLSLPTILLFSFVSTCRGTWPFVQCQALMWIIIKKQLEVLFRRRVRCNYKPFC